METSRFIKIIDKELIKFVEGQENPNKKEENSVRRRVIHEINSDIKSS